MEALLTGDFTDADIEAAFGYVSMMQCKNDGGYDAEAGAVAEISGRSVEKLWEGRYER